MEIVLKIIENDNLMNLNGLDNLTTIENSPNSSDSGLHIQNNDNLLSISALQNLTSAGSDLRIASNRELMSLQGLNNITSVGRDLTIDIIPEIVDLSGLNNLSFIGGDFSLFGNEGLVSLSGLQNITSIGEGMIIWANDNLPNFSGLENLEEIDYLSIFGNNNLVSLSGLQNLDYTTISSLEVGYNPTLSICEISSVCDYIANGGAIEINNNAPGCNDVTEIAAACSFTAIQADVFFDFNQNQIQDEDEVNYHDAIISVDEDLFYSQNEGMIFVLPGNYMVAFEEVNNPNWQVTTDSLDYFFSLGTGEIGIATFGIYPLQQISDIQTTLAAPPARCNETIILDAKTKNLGTTTVNGTMWLAVDNVVPEFNFIHQPDTTIANTNTYGWHFTDLFPSQAVEKQINIQIPGPPDFMLGDSLVFEAYVDSEDANGSQSSEPFIYETEVRCSYDPNDKLVNPNREGDYVLFEEDFIYTIRFQNTGNDVAYDVVIRDTLDANLDLSTFRLLGSSHANRLNTILNDDERTLTFEFRDIFLPDSTSNFEASQGYVNYLISPFDGLAEETPITNSAGIYFDLNPPVITNTTQSIMVSELPTVSIENPDNSFDFNVLPNPNTGIFTIQNIPNGIYQIHNTAGQIIQEGNMQNDLQIDISREAQGVYFISVTVDDATSVRRMVKM